MFDWMALWPLLAMALATGHVEEAIAYARAILLPPQQLLEEPAQTLVENASHAWDAGHPTETGELLHRAARAASDLGYL